MLKEQLGHSHQYVNKGNCPQVLCLGANIPTFVYMTCGCSGEGPLRENRPPVSHADCKMRQNGTRK